MHIYQNVDMKKAGDFWKKVLTKEPKACNIMQVVSKQRLEGKHGADGSAEKSLEKEKKVLDK